MINGKNLLDIIDNINESIDAYYSSKDDKTNKLDHEYICLFCPHDFKECGEMWCFKASKLKETLSKIYNAWWDAEDCDTCEMYLTEDCNKHNCENREDMK